MSVTGKVEFKTDPVKRVEGLSGTLQKRGIARAIKSALPPVVSAMQSAVPTRLGLLKQSISTKTKAYSRAVVGMVGPRSKFKKRVGTRKATQSAAFRLAKYFKFKGIAKRLKRKNKGIYAQPSRYAHLVDRGTKHSRAAHFLQKTLSSTQSQYLETVTTNIKDEINTALAK